MFNFNVWRHKSRSEKKSDTAWTWSQFHRSNWNPVRLRQRRYCLMSMMTDEKLDMRVIITSLVTHWRWALRPLWVEHFQTSKLCQAQNTQIRMHTHIQTTKGRCCVECERNTKRKKQLARFRAPISTYLMQRSGDISSNAALHQSYQVQCGASWMHYFGALN